MLKTISNSATPKYLAVLVAICLIQLVIVWHAINFFKISLTNEFVMKGGKDLEFLSQTISKKLREGNLLSVADFIQNWGEHKLGRISEVTLTSADGEILSQYLSPTPSPANYQNPLSTELTLSDSDQARLKLVVDTGFIRPKLVQLGSYFAAICLVLTTLLSFVAFLYLRKRNLLQQLHQHSLQLNRTISELQMEMSARSKAELELIESEKKYRTLMDNQSDAIFLHRFCADGSINFTEVNQRATEIYGYSRDEFLNLSPASITPQGEMRRLAEEIIPQQLANHGWMFFRSEHIKKSGETIKVEIKGTLLDWQGEKYILATARDLTERLKIEQKQEQLEQRILHAQKLESLGVLAGGIAHDFNNILMIILGHSELAQRKLNDSAPAREHIEQVKLAARRAADLSNQMLAYSGRGTFVVGALDLSRLISEMEHMLSVSVSKKAVLRYDLHPQLPSIEGDPTQIRQIIMNLVINASDAIGNKSGVIAISSGCMDCDQNYLKETWIDETLDEGMYVFLEVADTGCGMDKETINKIFDPFYTTKFTGRGLGMSSVLGIIRGHSGAIKIYSEVGKGTTIKALFPASNLSLSLDDKDRTTAPLDLKGTVLLVDDEESMRSLGRNMLETLGLKVVTATDGRDALRTYQARREEIALIIMDLTMPHMDGNEAFRELRRIDPDVKVIICSGFSEAEISQKFIGKGTVGFLQKPFQLTELHQTIFDFKSQ